MGHSVHCSMDKSLINAGHPEHDSIVAHSERQTVNNKIIQKYPRSRKCKIVMMVKYAAVYKFKFQMYTENLLYIYTYSFHVVTLFLSGVC